MSATTRPCLMSRLPGPAPRVSREPLSRPRGSFAYPVTRSLTFAYQITKIMPDMSRHLISKGVKCGHRVSKGLGAGNRGKNVDGR